MKISLELDISPTSSLIALQQLVDWAHRINTGQTGEPIPAPKTAAVPASPKERQLFNRLVETMGDTQHLPKADDTAPTEETEDSEETAESIQQTQPAGALPPGVEGPVKRKGGRPSKAMLAERAAAAQAEAERQAAVAAVDAKPVEVAPPAPPPAASASNGAVPPGMSTTNGARPPGINPALVAPPQPQLQQPAMPAQEPYSNGMYTKEDVRACYAQAVGHNPKGVHAIMRATTWPEGETKPAWFTVDMVAPMFFDRLIGELAQMIPAEG